MGRLATVLGLLGRPGWAGRTDRVESYERAFAATVLGEAERPALAFWRGRVALWAILRAAGVSDGEEVILPAYTCEMVPAAVKFAGGKCVYVDVAPGAFNPSAAQLADAITDRTRAIVCQHTYGIPFAVWDLAAARRGILIIEDCCHLIGGEGAPKGLAITGQAAFFSTQWSKPYSTGLGGMAVFSDRALAEAVRNVREGFPRDRDRGRSRSLALQVLLHDLTVRPMTRAVIARAYRWAQRRGIVRGTTTAEEYGRTMPADYLACATNVQAALGLQALGEWPAGVEHRRRLTEFYLEGLAALGADVSPMRCDGRPLALWGVPILVENAHEIVDRAGREGLPVNTWFGDLPVHITAARAGQYDYALGRCAWTEWMIPREVHLVTAPSVTLERAEAALRLIRQSARLARRG